MIEELLCKIRSIELCIGGYQDCELGLKIVLEGGSVGVQDFIGFWDYKMVEVTPRAKWTEKNRSDKMVKIMKLISSLLNDAKVKALSDLKNKPVSARFENGILKEWRILTEVI